MDFKALREKVETRLYNYQNMKAKISSCDSMPKTASDVGRIAPSGHVSDPVPTEAMKRVESNIGKWITTIDDVVNSLDSEQRQLIEETYLSQKQRPKRKNDNHRIRQIYEDLHMSSSTYYRQREKILDKIALDAVVKGLLEG